MIFAHEKHHDLEIQITGYSRSLEMTQFNRSHMTSHLCSIVTMALSCTVYDIYDSENATILKSS